MKNIFLYILLIAYTGFTLSGQSSTDHFSKNNSVKISPSAFAEAEFQLTFEHYFGQRNSSISITPSFILKDNPNETKEGWQIAGQYRFFLSHLRKDEQKTFMGLYNIGFYAGVYALYFDFGKDFTRDVWDEPTGQNISSEYRQEITSYEGGTIIGVQVDITQRILIDFFVGGGIRYSTVTDSYLESMETPYYDYYGVFDPEYKGVKPTVGFLLGITF